MRALLIIVLIIISFELTAQFDLNTDYRLEGTSKLIYNFKNSGKLVINNTNKENGLLYPKEFDFKIQDSLIVLFFEELPFDSLSVLSFKNGKLNLYQHSISDTIYLIEDNLFFPYQNHEILLNKEKLELQTSFINLIDSNNLDISIKSIGEEKYLFKRRGIFYEKENQKNCFRKHTYSIYKPDQSKYLILRISDREYESHVIDLSTKIEIVLNAIQNDTLIGELMPDKSPVKISINNCSLKSSDQLIGNYILFDNKSKLDKMLNKEHETIFIKHQKLNIQENSRCEMFSFGCIGNSKGNIHLETLGKTTLFLCTDMDINSKFVSENNYSFFIERKLSKIENDYLILSPFECYGSTNEDQKKDLEEYENWIWINQEGELIDRNWYLLKIN